MSPKKLAAIPVFQLLLGSALFGFSRYLFILADLLVCMLAISYMNQRPEEEKGKITPGRTLFFVLYVLVGISLLPAAILTLGFPYSNSLAWVAVLLYFMTGWFYPNLSKLGVAGAILYWFATLAFLGVILIPTTSYEAAEVAVSANLIGIYFRLLLYSPLLYLGARTSAPHTT